MSHVFDTPDTTGSSSQPTGRDRPRRSARFAVPLTATLLLQGACADDPANGLASTGPRPSVGVAADTGEVPSRRQSGKIANFEDMSDSAVFRAATDDLRPRSAVGAPTQAGVEANAQAIEALFYVGIKRPGSNRGWWQGQRLVDDATWRGGRQALADQPGVEIVWTDSLLPLVRAKVRDVEALGRLRRLPFIDYVSPALLPTDGFYHSSGCGWDADDTPWTIHRLYPDRIPESFKRSFVDDAWALSTGAGVTLGLTDTGVHPSAVEFFPNFTSGWSSGRWFQEVVTGGNYDCSHGLRMASVMAGPMNGLGYPGVAWRANLFSVRQANSVLVGTADPFQAIRAAGEARAHVITMAWGTQSYFGQIDDEIARLYDRQDVVFVGAAGTTGSTLSQNYVVFPANLPRVLAVSAINHDGRRDGMSHYGPELDIVAYDNIGSAGFGSGLTKIDHSSAATALVSGVAALVRARYPAMRNYEVYSRLKSTAGATCGIVTEFFHAVNAYAAVGGLCARQDAISGVGGVSYSAAQPWADATFTVSHTGGVGPFQYSWPGGSGNGPSATYRFYGDTQTCSNSVQLATVRITDLGVPDAAPITRTKQVQVNYRSTGPRDVCPGY